MTDYVKWFDLILGGGRGGGGLLKGVCIYASMVVTVVTDYVKMV